MKTTIARFSYLLILSLGIIFNASARPAATLYSYVSGGVVRWSTTNGPFTNSGLTPETKDHLTINSHTPAVTLGAWTLSGGDITVTTNATLTFSGNLEVAANTFLVSASGSNVIVNGNMQVSNNGVLTINGSMTVTGNFTNLNNSDEVSVNGTLDVGGNLSNGVGAVIAGTGGMTVGGSISNSGTIGTSTGNDLGTLPVELTEFEITDNTKGLSLIWRTATELNNDYFDVERSEDGVLYYKIARIDGNGTTDVDQNYSFTDHAPISSVEYYRLKQVDFDGAFEYSKTIVGYADRLADQVQMTTYPNPTAERLAFKSVRPIYFSELHLININGQIVANLTQNIEGFGLSLEVALPALDKGLYYIKYRTATGETGTQKLLIR